MTSAYDQPSGYQPRTQFEEARRIVSHLLADLDAGEVNEDTHYGMESYTAEEYILGGGGPGHDVTFIMENGDVRAAFMTYYEASGPVAISLTEHQATRLHEALQRPSEPNER